MSLWNKRGSAIVVHNDTTNREAPGNHAFLVPSSDGPGALGFRKANGVTEILSADTTTGAITVLDSFSTAKARMTPEGGLAIKLVAGENLAKGEVVSILQSPAGADGKALKTPISGNSNDMPLGVVYAAALLNADVWVVVSGIVEILPLAAVTAARGYVLTASTTTAGRVDQAATAPAAATHFKECGHFLDTGSGAGVLTRAIVHFN